MHHHQALYQQVLPRRRCAPGFATQHYRTEAKIRVHALARPYTSFLSTLTPTCQPQQNNNGIAQCRPHRPPRASHGDALFLRRPARGSPFPGQRGLVERTPVRFARSSSTGCRLSSLIVYSRGCSVCDRDSYNTYCPRGIGDSCRVYIVVVVVAVVCRHLR